MKSLTRFHRILIPVIASGVIFLFVSLTLSAQGDVSRDRDHLLLSGAVVSTIDREWREIILREIKSGNLQLEDFENIDFSLPGDPSYGDNPAKEFFNPEGPYKAHAIPQSHIDALAATKGTRILFNIRRYPLGNGGEGHIDPGTLVDYLYAVIPDVVERECIFSDSGNVVPTQGVPFDLAADNHSVVDDGFWFNGCVRTKDRRHTYYFHSFAQRVKKPGSDTWQIY